MSITESQHEKIAQLVLDLDSDEKNRRETAIALLTIMGHRAVGKLHETLKSRKPEIRRNTVKVLERIGDPRSLEPLLALLEDPDPGVRSLAIRSLSQFDAPHIVPRLIETCHKTPDPEARRQAATVLVSYALRRDKAAKKFILNRLLDGREDLRLRLIALEILEGLTKRECKTVAALLRKEGRSEITDRIAKPEPEPSGKSSREEVNRIVSELFSSDYFAWHHALQRIQPEMKDLPDLLLAGLVEQGAEVPLIQRIETALQKFGPSALDSIHRYLEQETRLETLEALLNLLRRFSDPGSVPYLRNCLKKLCASLKDPSPEPFIHERLLFLKAKIHDLLGTLACPAEKGDLLDMLKRKEGFPNALLLQAAGKIGDQHFLFPLLTLYGDREKTDPLSAEAAKTAFLKIASRKRIKATHKMFKNLQGRDQQILFKIFI